VGSFAAKALEPGDKLRTKLGGDGAIYREGKVRIRKDSALTWMAANPGAIGAAPVFKPVGAYPGKTVGGAALSIFPDDATGEAGLLQWIKFNADRGMTVGAFFHAQAPTAEELAERWRKKHPGEEPTAQQMKTWEAATKGNDPKRYLEIVARGIGKKPDEIRGKPLSAVDPKAVGEAMKQFVEKWVVGDELTVEAAVDDASLPTETRFQLLYTSWAKKK
jgi:hypothetical protein